MNGGRLGVAEMIDGGKNGVGKAELAKVVMKLSFVVRIVAVAVGAS